MLDTYDVYQTCNKDKYIVAQFINIQESMARWKPALFFELNLLLSPRFKLQNWAGESASFSVCTWLMWSSLGHGRPPLYGFSLSHLERTLTPLPQDLLQRDQFDHSLSLQSEGQGMMHASSIYPERNTKRVVSGLKVNYFHQHLILWLFIWLINWSFSFIHFEKCHKPKVTSLFLSNQQ